MSAADPIIVESVQRLFERHAPLALAQAATADGFEADLWQAAFDAGLTHALADESDIDAGGVGALANAAGIARLAGYHAAPLPLVEAMIAHRLAAEGHWADDDGLGQVVLAVVAATDGAAAGPDTLTDVPWGRHASAVYVLARHAGGHRIVRRERADWRTEAGSDLAGQPRDTLHCSDRAPTRGAATARTPADVLAWAALLRAAQMVGAMERTFDLALEHANTRVQFGKAIGKFQMVQQMLAQHANEIAAATAAVDLATDCTDWPSLHFYAGIAKARASEAAGVAAACAHQVTAAMGYATEYPLHLFTRRLWSWRDEYGDEPFWNRRVGHAAVRHGAAGLWPLLADGPSAREVQA